MQPDLPWNVAGIAPEAREAARASARREGLSVGEWLTRRILRGLPESDAAADAWLFAETARPRAVGENGSFFRQPAHAPGRELYSEPQSGGGNLERLAARIIQLDARIATIEAGAAERTKQAEAVRNLQMRVGELSERLSATASRHAAHGTELAKSVEALATKFVQARAEADRQRSATAEQVAVAATDVHALSEKLDETRALDEHRFRGVQERVVLIETVVEGIGRDRETVERLDGSFDTLSRRVEATEVEYLNNIEQLENRLTRVEADSGGTMIDRRLQGIEQALADMAALIGKNAGEKAAAIEAPASAAAPNPQPPSEDLRETLRHVPPSGTGALPPILDFPPFPEKTESGSAPPPADPPAASVGMPRAGTLGNSASRPLAPEVESFLAAARRNIRAANDTKPQATGAFSWVDPAVPNQKANEGANTRLILLAGLGLIALAAIGTGLYLSGNLAGTPPIPHSTASYTAPTPIRPKQQIPPPVQTVARGTPLTEPNANPATSFPPAATVDAATPQRHAPPSPMRLKPPAVPQHAAPPATTSIPLTPQQRLAGLAGAGNAKAQEVLGLEYVDGDGVPVNEAEGAKWLERAASHGEVVAAYRLGTMYERGHGVAADPAKATRWYAVAAKAGNRKAMHNLAVAYAQGSGVQKDLALAAQWFLRAANLGLADSQFNLAVLYERGLGVQQSLAEAYKWYAIAAAQGDPESKTRMEALASQLAADDKAAADKAAAAFQPAPLDRAANAPPIAASLVGG